MSAFENPPDSPLLAQAREKIESAGKALLTSEEREKAAIDLAELMLRESTKTLTHREKKTQEELGKMMRDPQGKVFTTSMTDQCFRSNHPPRIANQLIYLLNTFGIPKYLSPFKRLQLYLFKVLGPSFSYLLVPLAAWALRKQTSSVILPGEPKAFAKHIKERKQQGVRLNINHLGEAILGEIEAKRRLQVYLDDLARDGIEYVSVKISTIFSQINMLANHTTMEHLSDRLRQLYRAAIAHPIIRSDGTQVAKFVNLDMEEYRDLYLTKDLFKKVLDEPEFHTYSAGIVLQAYLPDCFDIQKELTEWAINRRKNGGAPIKIRIVKGANLAMEQVDASLHDWPQAPYKLKKETDSNYKRMATYGCQPEHAGAVHLGLGSHNLFDIAYCMLLRAEHHVENEVGFEMLEGMADHMRRVVQRLAKEILLYCAVATREDFQSAIAYLIRRLDENTGPENFLRHAFSMTSSGQEWQEQTSLFTISCKEMKQVSHAPRRTQNRFSPPNKLPLDAHFENEPDTDFSLPHNQEWAHGIIDNWQKKKIDPIPLVIAGKEIHQQHPEGEGFDPAFPNAVLYHYCLADWKEVDKALDSAQLAQKKWNQTSVHERAELLSSAAQKMREKRADLIGVMIKDGGKTIAEGDPEVSEAIDFADYYLRSMLKMNACKDIEWAGKGTILVAPPWNFPVSIPAGGILAALISGNSVIFKPAPEAVLTGWILVNALWEAGISKEVLQFINCADEPVGSKLIADPRLAAVILTGATSTAKLFMRLRPGLDLAAETGGKNPLIITAMADRDLAIKDLIQSAFGHSGQKCSAASLGILEKEVYDDPHFRQQLRDAVNSLPVGTAWDSYSRVVPLIRAPGEALLRGLTTLEEGEAWLVEPKQDPKLPNLWSPGVKLGVKEGSFMHCTELFGPVLGLMRAKDLNHAISLANGTPYGLTSGLHSLDEREHRLWMEKIEAGNLYINRGITGAIVRRQPFGGCKASSFGQGAKAGGPNYVAQFAHGKQVGIPHEKAPISEEVNQLNAFLSKIDLSPEELGIWYASIASDAYWKKRFSEDHDPSKIVGQDNLFRYKPRKGICLRIQEKDTPLDILRIIAAALSCHAKIDISWTRGLCQVRINDTWPHLIPFSFIEETEDHFNQRVRKGSYERIRLATAPTERLRSAAAESACILTYAPVLANGRFELLHYLREEAISINYHRYGYLGTRENEIRTPIV